MTHPTSSNSLTVGDCMAVEPILIRADASLTDAVGLMDRRHVHGLPVVDAAGSLVGVVSQTDLARARATEYLWSSWPGLAVRHLTTSANVPARKRPRSVMPSLAPLSDVILRTASSSRRIPSSRT